MKKIIFTIITLTVCLLSASSQTMTVKLKNGQKVTYQTSGIEGVEFEEAYNPGDGATYHNGHEYVDLGLPSGKLWATCNVGANKPEDIGDYFAWGETEPKDYYSKENSEFYKKGVIMDISKTEYDVAHVKWGGNWRIPTKLELSEMTGKCSWSLVIKDGNRYFVGKGPNGNTITLPATGWMENYNLQSPNNGEYWSSESQDKYYFDAWILSMSPTPYCERVLAIYHGLCVRPIFPPEN